MNTGYPLLTVEDVIDQNLNDFHFFWKSFLSQFNSKTPIKYEYIHYSTAEHFMHGQKALLFGDKEIYRKIIMSTQPSEALYFGRLVKNFDQEIWDKHKVEIVYKGNLLRYQQNPEWADQVNATFPQILVEASPIDPVWGIGLDKEDPRCKDAWTWQGQNLLGFILTKVRNDEVIPF